MPNYTDDLNDILAPITELLRKLDEQNAHDHMDLRQRLDDMARKQDEIVEMLKGKQVSTVEFAGHNGRGLLQ